jgi:hypothetical protein
MSEENKEINDFIKFLVDMGVLKPLGYDVEIGDDVFIITDKAEELLPGLHDAREKDTNAAIFELWQRNMLDVIFDDDGMPLVSLNKNSTNKEKIESIEDPDLKSQMYMIVQAFASHFDENNNK